MFFPEECALILLRRVVASAIVVGSIYGYLKKPMKSMCAIGSPTDDRD